MSNKESQDWDNYRALVLDNFTRINKRLELIESNIDEMKDNHLHHVQLEMQKLKTQVNLFGKIGVVVFSFPGIILAIIQTIILVAK